MIGSVSALDMPRTAADVSDRLRPGARIANDRGVAGILASFALTLDDRRPVCITNEHVLFGTGARRGEPVYLLDAGAYVRIGRTGEGRRGLVQYAGEPVYVDCATVSLDPWLAEALDISPCLPGSAVARDAGVTLRTSASSAPRGIATDTAYQGPARIFGRDCLTRGQIRVRAEAGGTPLGEAGHSGAALLDHGGAVVGLVWGGTAQGEALACPIAPVLWLLHVELATAKAKRAGV